MNAIAKGLFSFFAVVPLVGCAAMPKIDIATPPSIAGEAPHESVSGKPVPAAPASTPSVKQADRNVTQTVTIYAADAQCESLIPQQIEVPQGNSLNASIGEIINRWNSGDFRLAGYRVSTDANTGVATVDFRVAPDSERVILSLSSCERYALFGSISETLTSNPQWQITEVRFTDRGEAIVF